MSNTLGQVLYARRCDAHASVCEECGAFECRTDAEPGGVAQLTKLALDHLDERTKAAEQLQARTDLEPQNRSPCCLQTNRDLAEHDRAAVLITPSRESLESGAFRRHTSLEHVQSGTGGECDGVIDRRLQMALLGGPIATNNPARIAFAGRHDRRRVIVVRA